jgi:hypothetical protein
VGTGQGLVDTVLDKDLLTSYFLFQQGKNYLLSFKLQLFMDVMLLMRANPLRGQVGGS